MGKILKFIYNANVLTIALYYTIISIIGKIMAKANVNVRIDSQIKELATKLLDRMGLDQTTAIDMYYRQIIAERRLPFQPVVRPTPDEQIAALAIKNTAKD